MRKLQASDIRDLNLFKHYRIVRKWACKNNKLNDAELELLIYFDCMGMFTKQDFKIGTYAYSWDNRRWNRLLKQGWIKVWRERNRTTQKYHIYKVSTKCSQLISRIYRIMLGEEDMPTKILDDNNKYIYKVTAKEVHFVNKDKTRSNGI